jgi:hypothetical protein
MGKPERKEQVNEESMMWSHFVAVQWQITNNEWEQVIRSYCFVRIIGQECNYATNTIAD